MRGGAFLKGKEGRVGFRKNSLWLKGDGGIRKPPSLTVRKVSVPCKGNRRGRKDF